MSKQARSVYAIIAVTVGSWLAILWGADQRVALAVTAASALALTMAAHNAITQRCGHDVRTELSTCVLEPGHVGKHVDRQGYQR